MVFVIYLLIFGCPGPLLLSTGFLVVCSSLLFVVAVGFSLCGFSFVVIVERGL